METLSLPAKAIRAKVISRYAAEAGYDGVVVFTCGNAASALRAEGVDVLEVGAWGELVPGRWWRPAEIRRVWPNRFDATSGHLPAPLMVDIAKALRAHLGELPLDSYTVPTGSGETIVCLRWAYPDKTFVPAYGGTPEVEYSKEAPLNLAVGA